ncbi:MAG TPA: DUF3553 domain-containing protein [Phycisphaerales bacterium]|nr:DUF3553 domain-containing protein [Phycisphaerales bacterium]HRQ75245.1 DUF3553 domain-containing protein [Phycisphaerales bacterium]
MMKAEQRFQFGDRVRHVKKPEWGIGTISKTEDTAVNGNAGQRLTIRFPNAGIKTLFTGAAEIEVIEEQAADLDMPGGETHVKVWDRLKHEGDWLSPHASRKVDEAMVTLPENVRDPFRSLPNRLAATMELYRFDRTGRSLVDWAVAQSGLDDPLSRFTRHELERLFDRWATQRENHLRELLQTAKYENASVNALVEKAPKPARDAVKRLGGVR